MNFRDFRVFNFVYRPQNENPKITENLCFSSSKVQMDMDLFFDHYFNFLSAKTGINKDELNLINLGGLEALKRQLLGAWLGIWLYHFEIDIIRRSWCYIKCSMMLHLMLHSHISVLRLLSRVFRDFRVFVFGRKAENEIPEITENLYFSVFSSQTLSNLLLCLSFLFLLAEFIFPLFNCYFRDFRGFHDFRVFDLTLFSRTPSNGSFLG